MFDIEISNKKGVQVIDSKLLHKKLEVKSYHADWIRRRIENYQFEEGVDYFNSKMSKSIGRPTKTYLLTLDMAKELCMLENNDNGKATRKYFIKCEKGFRKLEAVRIASKEVRKSLTDAVSDSGENERMHGRGYSNYTKMVYKLLKIDSDYITWKKFHSDEVKSFREYISTEDLRRVEIVESMIKPLLDLDKEYSEIKEILKPLFENKKVSKV